jgi:hypothetical protein
MDTSDIAAAALKPDGRGRCNCARRTKDRKAHPACAKCHGKGILTACLECGGSGWKATANEVCSKCQGNGYLQ